jgi:DNA-binding NarL/FixJ family response regulator
MSALDDGGSLSGLILDVGLPDGSGLDVLAHDRKTHPTTPALVLTGDTERETINTAYNLGAAFLVKPVELSAVERFLARAIETGFAARVERVVQVWTARYKLSEAEADVLQQFALGHNRDHIVETRESHPSTIQRHISNLLRRTGDSSLSSAAARLLRELVVTSPPPLKG